MTTRIIVILLLILLIVLCFQIWEDLEEAKCERMAERIQRDAERGIKEIDETIRKMSRQTE